jgi:putative membrane-bound dehydrogenase-like protein
LRGRGEREKKGGGRIRFLEDTDGDGKYDKSTLFLDGVAYPNGVMPWRKGVLISAAPDIIYAEDTDGDGKADVREVVYTGFKEGNQQHRVNGFSYGLDNWIYLANGDSGGIVKSMKTDKTVNISGRDIRIRPDTGEIEAVAGQTQFGRNRDDWGNWFGSNNSNPMFQFVLDDHYQRRNAHFPSPSGKVDVPKVAGNAPVFPISQTVARFNDFHTANRFTSACSAMIYRDDLFGPHFAGNMFVSEPVHNLVHREVVSRNGVTFTSVRAPDEQQSEFLASSDNWFRPTMIKTGPDGALWIADMYRHVIEHPQWIPDTWQKRLDLRAGHDKGRIYRVYPVGAKPRAIKRLDRLTDQELVAALDSPNGWQRDTAQRLLIDRLCSPTMPAKSGNEFLSQKSLVSEMYELVIHVELWSQFHKGKTAYARLHSLCALDGIARDDKSALNVTELTKAIADEHPAVRRHAVRLSGRFADARADVLTAKNLNELLPTMNLKELLLQALLNCVSDSDPHVRLQLAYTLGEIDDPRAGRVLGELLAKSGSDRYLFAAAMSSINKTNVEQVLVGVLANRGTGTPNLNLVEGLLNLAAAFGNNQALVTLLNDVATPREGKFEPWQFAAVGGLLDTLDRQNKPLAKLSQSSDEALRGAIDKLRAVFMAARVATGSDAATQAARVSAIGLLGRGPENHDYDLALLGTFLSPQTNPELQEAAVTTLGRLNDPKAISLLIDNWRSFGPGRRTQVLDILLSRDASHLQLIRAIDNQTIAVTEFDATRRQRLTQSRSEAIRRAAAQLFADTINADRQKIIDQYRPALEAPANPSRGAQLFARTCAQCHKLKETGYDVGPDLASLTDKSPESLLVAILDPNRAVETKFLNYAAITKSGLTFSGLLAAETGNSITLRGPEAKEQTILRADLEELVSTSKSTMPEGLEKDLKPQDVADIIAYVRANVPLPVRKKFAGNSPALVRVQSNGMLLLSAAACEIYGSTLVYEQQHGNLGYWSSLDDFALWNFEVAKPGPYAVEFDYACDGSVADINLWTLDVGRTSLTGRVPSTGSWETYKTARFGEIELSAGRHQLTLRAANKIQGAMIDLRSIRLTPVK